jgi:hypothetical protein
MGKNFISFEAARCLVGCRWKLIEMDVNDTDMNEEEKKIIMS